MPQLPDIDGVISAEEVIETAEWIASLQLDTGMIPWFPGGHCDPWNHVETTMALDVAGFHAAAECGYEWLVDIRRDDGSWWNYYLPDGTVEEDKLDTNVCAYIATGVWHHWLCTWDRAFVDHLWPTVQRALDWVLSMRREDGTVIWACTADDRPWNYALLTGSSSIAHALRCGANLAALCNEPRPDWITPPTACASSLTTRESSNRRDRWAMDWYHLLAGCMTGERAMIRLPTVEFAMSTAHSGVSDSRSPHPRPPSAIAHANRRCGDGNRPAALDPPSPPPRRGVLHGFVYRPRSGSLRGDPAHPACFAATILLTGERRIRYQAPRLRRGRQRTNFVRIGLRFSMNEFVIKPPDPRREILPSSSSDRETPHGARRVAGASGSTGTTMPEIPTVTTGPLARSDW
jgi:hypothetical protein